MAFTVMSIAVTMIMASIITLLIVFNRDPKPKEATIEPARLRQQAVSEGRAKRSTRKSESDNLSSNPAVIPITVAATSDSEKTNRSESTSHESNADYSIQSDSSSAVSAGDTGGV